MVIRQPLPHQIQALEYAAPRSRIALFMEMRLGKTLVAIRWARLKRFNRILVVAPLATFMDWTEELKMEGIPEEDIVPLYDLTKSDRIFSAQDSTQGWFLLNYEGLRVTPELSELEWDAMILDESARIRNPKAQITKLILNRFSNVLGKALLTGLPNPESPMDYFCQMKWLFGHFMGLDNYWIFRQRYFVAHPRLKWLWEPKANTITAIKSSVHEATFVMTKKNAGIGNRKIFQTRTVAMTPDQKKDYRSVKKYFEWKDLKTKWATTKFIWMARIAGGFAPDGEQQLSTGKIDLLIDLLKNELAQEPVVVWFRFNREIDAAVEALKKHKIPALPLYGATPRPERVEARQKFNTGEIRVLLIQLKLGLFGLNLSKASTAIYYSNAYDLESRSQSQERIEHPTKKRPLLYIDLITERTLDMAVVQTLRDKNVNARTFHSQLIANIWAQHESQGQEDKGASRKGPTKVWVKTASGGHFSASDPAKARRVRRVYPGESGSGQ